MWIDFGQNGETKNHSGFSWNLALLMQKKFNSYTMGFRCVFGINNDYSKIKYKSSAVSTNGDVYNILEKEGQTEVVFCLKNKWFTEFIFEFGYVIGQSLQLFVGPGLVLQKQNFSYLNPLEKSYGNLSKTVPGSMLACGARYALNQRVSLGLEYQRQWLSKKNWSEFSSIVPKNLYHLGTPSSKTNANLFLVTLTYMFGKK
ncbi:hypothetical protein HE1_00587 [Holospora elegans E1]|uniref:Uncharacterized protein n=1 Tax=Holospora elegans E1 TaxID=1427503 RepID=A0A023DZ17_9PROT|nr:outer membrane beta-barrel protein [Holospora elegans]GAJ46260.1 hypothetical protein HE1_00587 [Holospora elegans E1]